MPAPLAICPGRPAGRPTRRRLAAATSFAALLLVFAIGAGGCGLAGGTASLGPTTTVVLPTARLAVEPLEGPVGTLFTLTAEGMVAGAAVQFEITFPGEGRAYPGNALVVGDDGTASATYRATPVNQPGTYVVRLTGPQGQLATAEFRVTDGRPVNTGPSTTKGTGPSTTARAGSTPKATSTTRSGGGSTAPPSTARPTTTAGRPSPSTVPPTTTPPTTAPAPPTTG